MSSLIPPKQELPTLDPQDVADDRDMARIARMLISFEKALSEMNAAPDMSRRLSVAVAPEIARKVFTDGN